MALCGQNGESRQKAIQEKTERKDVQNMGEWMRGEKEESENSMKMRKQVVGC